MKESWFRMSVDFPTDLKWLVIARISKQKVGDVGMVFAEMLATAKRAEVEGSLEGWNDEAFAAFLGIEASDVEAIRLAMEGRVIKEGKVIAWNKRQPKRGEDPTAYERKQRYKQRHGDIEERTGTDGNAEERKKTLDKTIKDLKSKDYAAQDALALSTAGDLVVARDATDAKKQDQAEAKRGTRLPADWVIPDAWIAWARKERPAWDDAYTQKVGQMFRDYWTSKPGNGAYKLDWFATWRFWVNKEREQSYVPAKKRSVNDIPQHTADKPVVELL
jgi:hypothetical protein